MMISFVGIVRKERDIGRFRIVETEYAAGTRIHRHAHRHPYFYFVLAGDFTEHLSHGSARYRPGCVTYRAAGEPHATVIGGKGARCLMVEVSKGPFVEPCLPALPRNGSLAAWSSDLVACGTRLLREFSARDMASTIAAEGHILAILAHLARAAESTTSTVPMWLTTVEEFLRDTCPARADTLQLCRIAGVSRAHLSRSFRQHYRCTIGEFVRGLRLADAERALQLTDRPIGAVAHTAGFCDQSHFTREFRRRNGMTPGAFRRLHRKPGSMASKNATRVL